MQSQSKILICDDSRADAQTLGWLLESEGYGQVTLVNDPTEVLPRLASERFNLILLDIQMPKVSGIELARLIREEYSEPALPILIVSATSAAETRNLALSVGANDYLTKPVSPEEMFLRVKNLLRFNEIYNQQYDAEQALEKEVKFRTAKLDMLISNGIMMSRERDRKKLLKQILDEGKALLNCDAATIYLKTDHQTLRFELRTKSDHLPTSEINLHDPVTGKLNEQYVSVYVAAHNKPVLIDDTYQETGFDLSGTKDFDQKTSYRTISMLTVPIALANNQVLGVLQFLNALDPESGKVIPFSPELLSLVNALAAQAAVALDNIQLLEEQNRLMDNSFQVIATAIDAKSPYTGRHCSRVPELALMLAKAAHDDHTIFNDFRFDSPEEWREFRIGAWLHDCGKVTTPEHVIDKATKLETIYNRIHEIRMRFEVLLRDARIEQLQAQLSGVDAAVAEAKFRARQAQLESDFAFIATRNTAAGETTPVQQERILKIAEETWIRHFDDCLGISTGELERIPSDDRSPLPATEHLLSDKPRHIIRRDPAHIPDPSFGFKMKTPENQYNFGEVYNLSIPHGTLTEEERYKINEHMISTIIMLEQMHFPKSLQRVPEYAGTHHENLIGTGYPRKLTAEGLSVPSRIMAIADIFEALTAPDRPYKKPNTISESIKILHSLKKKHLIDPNLFDLFLTSETYLDYAREFLQPEQIDAVNITDYLG